MYESTVLSSATLLRLCNLDCYLYIQDVIKIFVLRTEAPSQMLVYFLGFQPSHKLKCF